MKGRKTAAIPWYIGELSQIGYHTGQDADSLNGLDADLILIIKYLFFKRPLLSGPRARESGLQEGLRRLGRPGTEGVSRMC